MYIKNVGHFKKVQFNIVELEQMEEENESPGLKSPEHDRSFRERVYQKFIINHNHLKTFKFVL